jgi:hypothetical protein
VERRQTGRKDAIVPSLLTRFTGEASSPGLCGDALSELEGYDVKACLLSLIVTWSCSQIVVSEGLARPDRTIDRRVVRRVGILDGP